MILLKIHHLLRCFNFIAIAAYTEYTSFLGNLTPCIRSILICKLMQDCKAPAFGRIPGLNAFVLLQHRSYFYILIPCCHLKVCKRLNVDMQPRSTFPDTE